MGNKVFNGRILTDPEQALHLDGNCIVCGQPAHVVKRHDNTQRVDFECNECFKSRTNYASNGPDFGAATASVGHEFRRRLGYSSRDGGSGKIED